MLAGTGPEVANGARLRWPRTWSSGLGIAGATGLMFGQGMRFTATGYATWVTTPDHRRGLGDRSRGAFGSGQSSRGWRYLCRATRRAGVLREARFEIVLPRSL